MTSHRFETVLLTGAGGFVGGHLIRHLLGRPDAPKRLVALDVREGAAGDGVSWVRCDMTDAAQVRRAVSDAAPQAIVHLAGVTHGNDLTAYFASNVRACQNLLAAAAELLAPPRVLVVGSASQYGVTTGGYEDLDESRPLVPTTPYAVSKTLQEKWALLYHREKALPVICVRPFNIMGPGQPPSLVPAAFLYQVADVLDGRAREIRVGNTGTSRDFLDVRDLAAALWALMGAGDHVLGRVFNIASGEAVSIADMLEACIRLSGRQIPVCRDPARLCPADAPTVVGNAGRLRAATGWRSTISWRQSLESMWNALRNRR